MFPSLFRRLKAGSKHTRMPHRQRATRRLSVEPLEDRMAPSATPVRYPPTVTFASSLENLTEVSGTAFFTADDGVHGRELWKSDGTLAGTALVKDITPGSSGTRFGPPANVNGTLFFGANGGLWKSDGTAAGTVLVKDVYVLDYNFTKMTNVNGTLFFIALTGPSHERWELWKSDGTAAGTVPLQLIWLGTVGFDLNLTNMAGTLYFAGHDAA